MASKIIQLSQNGGNQNGGATLLPVTNGQTSLTDILGFAAIASIFQNIFGNGNGYVTWQSV